MQDEEEPSAQYVRGYNHGYQLARFEPDLLNKLLGSQSQQSPNEYTQAMQQGKEQYEREKLMQEMKAIRERRQQTIKRKR